VDVQFNAATNSYEFFDSDNNVIGTIDLNAGNIAYDNTTSGLTSEDVQTAIDELVNTIEANKGNLVVTEGIEFYNATDGINKVLADVSLRIADGGVTTEKLANGAITTDKIDDEAVTIAKINPGDNDQVLTTNNSGDVEWLDKAALRVEPWNVENTTIQATGNTQNIYQQGNVGIGNFNSEAVSASLDVRQGNVRVRDINNANGVTVDKMVVADEDGVLKTVKQTPRFFYMPSVVFDTSVTGGGLSRNLYQDYVDQFSGTPLDIAHGASGSSMPYNGGLVGSTGAPAQIAVYESDELYYYITYFDEAVFSGLSINADGVLTYNIDSNASDVSYMNIVFVVKEN